MAEGKDVGNSLEPGTITTRFCDSRPLCPRLGCNGRMEPDPRVGSLADLGLHVLNCPVCRHRGYRPLEDIRVLFGTRHEHICSYGPSIHSLTILFSGDALTTFRNEGLGSTQSALYAANWALLDGQVVGTLRFFLETPAFMRCHAYFRCQGLRHIADCSTRSLMDPAQGTLSESFHEAPISSHMESGRLVPLSWR